MKKIVLIIILLVIAAGLIAKSQGVFSSANAYCKESGTDTNYCKYQGKITKVYLNSDNVFLVFLEKPFNIEDAKKYGYPINSGTAIALSLNETPSSQQFISMLTRAFNNELSVEIHTRGINSGYMELDRLWVSK